MTVKNASLVAMLRESEQAAMARNFRKVDKQADDLAAGAPLRSRYTSLNTFPSSESSPSTTKSKAQEGHSLTPEKTLPVGRAVRLSGLKAIDFNGKIGKIINNEALSSGRVVVELSDGETKSFKVENVSLLESHGEGAADNDKENVQVESKVQTEIVPLTQDEFEWLTDVAARSSLTGISAAVQRLVEWSNTEAPEAKQKLFLQIRCRRCSAGAKGGVKHDQDIELPAAQWQWLKNVKDRCKHASVGKTIRIITDFYMPLCKEQADFEQQVFRAVSHSKTSRHQDAVGKVRTLERACGA
jgi:hypothetical protein